MVKLPSKPSLCPISSPKPWVIQVPGCFSHGEMDQHLSSPGTSFWLALGPPQLLFPTHTTNMEPLCAPFLIPWRCLFLRLLPPFPVLLRLIPTFGKSGKRRKRRSPLPAAFWKASMAWLRPGREVRSCRAPIWVCSAPRLKRTLPFSKARALWWDGTPVRESYLEKGRANSCPSPGHSPQSVPVMVHKKCPRSWKGGWNWMSLKVLSNLYHSMIPVDAGGARRVFSAQVPLQASFPSWYIPWDLFPSPSPN